MALTSLILLAGALADQPAPTIPFEKYELDNGLDVILAEDHSIPFVQVNIWYDVGSKDEVAGRTGFAHLYEHLMFQGSAHHDTEYFQPLESVGASINGTTSFDRTNYFEGVPAEYLPLALWLESDRMGWLLPALTQEKLDNQREVVRNERRQRYENTPYGEVWVWLFENLYPEGHPYHVPTIGRHEDLEAATLEDVTAFFNTWYAPNNATLTICGDFDPAEAKALVQQYFGEIPRGEEVRSVTTAEAALTEEIVVHKTDDVPHPRLWIAWISPALYASGDAELDIVSTLLADGKDSLLYRTLVLDKQLAKDVEAYQYSARLHGQYIIEATPAEGHTTDELLAEIDALLAGLRADGPDPDEVSVAVLNWEARFFDGLQTISSKANMLNSYNTFTGDPGFITADLERYRGVTAASVSEALSTWLPADRRVVLHVTPEAATPEAGEEE
jgi:zinc protease